MKDDRSDDSGHIAYNPKIGTYVAEYDKLPSVAIIEAISEITDTDVTELNSLGEVTPMDVEALDELFQPTFTGVPREEGRVELVYEGFEVRIFSFGRIEIEPLDEDDQ